MDYRYLRCRGFGHSWGEPYIDAQIDREYRTKGGAGRKVCQHCPECGTTKVGVMDWLGNLLTGHWSYQYPEDYRWATEEPVGRHDWRINYLRAKRIKIKP